MSRFRTAKIILSASFLALAGAASAACGDQKDPDMEQACVDTRGTRSDDDDIRVDDDRCGDRNGHGHGMFIWGFYPFGYSPAVGSGAKSTGKSYSTTKSGVIGKAPQGGSTGGKGGSSGG